MYLQLTEEGRKFLDKYRLYTGRELSAAGQTSKYQTLRVIEELEGSIHPDLRRLLWPNLNPLDTEYQSRSPPMPIQEGRDMEN